MIALSAEAESVRYCDALRRKLGAATLFLESSEINPTKFLLCRRPFLETCQKSTNAMVKWF